MNFSMAFQPIVDVVAGRAYAYEALVRGPSGQPAAAVFSQVRGEDLYRFDHNCRQLAIRMANDLGLVETGACLAVNFLPRAIYSSDTCISKTLEAAETLQFPTDRLIFEISETEEIDEPRFFRDIVAEYQRTGCRMAIDDFGAGYSNLNLLADISPDVIKLDLNLVRNIHLRPRAQAIVCAAVNLCQTTRMDLIAEGIETFEEYTALRACGVRLMQGYLLARPEFEQLPCFCIPENTHDSFPSARRNGHGFHLFRHTGA